MRETIVEVGHGEWQNVTRDTSADPVTAALRELFDRLTYEGYGDRVQVIRHAAEWDGLADADAVYISCEYDEDRTLRGFTSRSPASPACSAVWASSRTRPSRS